MEPLGTTLLAKILVIGGFIAIIAGGFLFLTRRFPWGRLPGDIALNSSRGSFFFPIVTSIILSVILTVVLNLCFWLFRR